MNIYEIIKSWFELSADNSKITGNHTALFFYIIDLNNRLAWKEVFGLPSIETSQFLNISYNTFRKILDDLIELKVIKLVKKSKNQYTANQISIEPLCQNLLKQKKSTYKAFVEAQQKQLKSTCDIDIHKYNNTLLHIDKLNIDCENLKKQIFDLTSENENLKKQIQEKRNENYISKAREFYDNEISEIKDVKYKMPYLQWIEVIFGKNSHYEPFESILKMQKQLKYLSFYALLDKFKFDFQLIVKKTENLNYYHEVKKYKEIYSTLKNWCEMEIKKQTETKLF